MPSSANTYEALWNELSWEVSEAVDGFFTMTAILDWQNRMIEELQQGQPVLNSPYIGSVFVIFNSIVTHFFITACRIREEKRSTLNLLRLLSIAKDKDLLSRTDIAHAKELVAQTERTFKKLKKARGMAVAHLLQPQNPFQILRSDGVTRSDVLSFLTDCDALFWLLGKPLGKTSSRDVSARGALISVEVEHMLGVIWPRSKQPGKV